MDELFDEEQQKIQKSLNQAKKRELAEKYGARFSEESDVDPEIESKWLDSIEEYERQYKDSRQVSVREFVGNPKFKPFGEVPSVECTSFAPAITVVIDPRKVANLSGANFLTGEVFCPTRF